MNWTGSAKRARALSDGARATHFYPDITIGHDILELLSSAMYVDPITIYREYVQNAADAVDLARHEGILTPDQPGRVDIYIDPQARSVRIRDNGCGVPAKAFGRRLLALGGSQKRGTSARGFRGVGRLAGLGYAREVVFRASTAGETVTSELRWDCRRLKAALLAPDYDGNAADLIESVTSLESHGDTDADEHFFEVQLNGVVRLGKDQLTSPSAVAAYLGQVAPVPFVPEFRFGTEIATALSKHTDTGSLLIRINDAPNPIYRPHRARMVCGEKRELVFESVEVVELPSIDDNVAAIAWILHHQYEGALPSDSMVKGLRLRSGDIQVGGHAVLADLFPESRFNSWTVGEVHVLDRRIVPNGRRDHFEQNTHYNNLLNHLVPTARALARRCRSSSIQRKWQQEFDVQARVADEKLAIIAQGSLGKSERNRMALDVEKILLKMTRINEMRYVGGCTGERADRITSLRSKLTSLLNENAASASALARLPDRKRQTYERFFELIYECSTNRVAARALVDRILLRLG